MIQASEVFGSSFTSEGFFFPMGRVLVDFFRGRRNSGFFQGERVIVDFPGGEVLVDFSRGRGNLWIFSGVDR